ncbi:MAG: hypothetical protein ABSD38_29470, partial [Syntrophorhabdales bacterium]
MGITTRLRVYMQAGPVRLKRSLRPLTTALPPPEMRKYYPRAARFRWHPHLKDRFSKAGKTILDPSMRTVHTPPGLL